MASKPSIAGPSVKRARKAWSKVPKPREDRVPVRRWRSKLVVAQAIVTTDFLGLYG